jgi:hypothetical protein
LDVESKPDPILYLTIKSENVFSETPSVVSLTPNIDSMKDPILDLLKGLSETGETLTNFEPLEVTLPLLNMSIDDLLSGNSNFGLGDTLDFYTPALEYFTLLEVFNFDINDHLAEIGSHNGIGISDFDIHDENHRLKLKNLLENENDLSLGPDWDLSLYLPEIWSLFNPDFEISDHLPQFQRLLGLPYVPVMDEIRSDLKSYFGAFPNLRRWILRWSWRASFRIDSKSWASLLTPLLHLQQPSD